MATPVLPIKASEPVSLALRLNGPMTHLTYKPASTPNMTSKLSSRIAKLPMGEGEYSKVKGEEVDSDGAQNDACDKCKAMPKFQL